MSFKKDYEGHGPGWFEVIFAAWLAMALGAVLAGFVLITKPVVEAAEPPDAIDREQGVVYYTAGKVDSAKGREWISKRLQFLRGETIQLNEEELNAAFGKLKPKVEETPKPAAKPSTPAGAQPPAGEEAELPLYELGFPNFRLVNDKIQISVALNSPRYNTKIIIQTSGHYERWGDTICYKPDQTYIGSLPLYLIPRAQDTLFREIMSRVSVPDDIGEAWDRLADVKIENGSLQLVAP